MIFWLIAECVILAIGLFVFFKNFLPMYIRIRKQVRELKVLKDIFYDIVSILIQATSAEKAIELLYVWKYAVERRIFWR